MDSDPRYKEEEKEDIVIFYSFTDDCPRQSVIPALSCDNGT